MPKSKQQLEAEAAFILEQEGWLITRLIHEKNPSSRLKRFSERYQKWQAEVKACRESDPKDWPEPPDNS